MDGWITNDRFTGVEFVTGWDYEARDGNPDTPDPEEGEAYLEPPDRFSGGYPHRPVREDRMFATEREAKESLIVWNREWIAKRQRGIARRERANARLEASMLEPVIDQTATDLAPTLGGR